MSTLSLPPDLAEATISALQYYPDDPTVRRFRYLVVNDAAFAPHRPRQLIRIAHRHEAAVEGTRFMSVLLTGFHGPQRARMMAVAVTRLRQAIADVAAGIESSLLQGPGIWSMSDGGPKLNPDDLWNPPNPFGEVRQATAADIEALHAMTNPTVTPSSTPTAPSSGPQFPRGTVLTRPWTSGRSRS